MKNIYMISLDDDVPLSQSIRDEMRLLCYLVYDEIRRLDYENVSPILCNDGIDYNELLESYNNGEFHYRFMYNDIESGKHEPFMINDTSFGFTINNDSISEDEIWHIIENYKKMIKFTYNLKLKKYSYEDDKKHKNRLITLKKIISEKSNKKEDP